MINKAKQSTLEIKGVEKRHEQLIRSDYNKIDYYSDKHEDALSNPSDYSKVLGKGTGNGGHQAYVPDHSKSPNSYNRSSLNTQDGGGAYDIYGRNEEGGRNRLVKINLYNSENPYGHGSVDTSSNIEDGQYVIK